MRFLLLSPCRITCLKRHISFSPRHLTFFLSFYLVLLFCSFSVCIQFSRGVYSMLGSVSPDSFDTLHSYSNTFQMPFVTPWFPEQVRKYKNMYTVFIFNLIIANWLKAIPIKDFFFFTDKSKNVWNKCFKLDRYIQNIIHLEWCNIFL